MTGRRDLERKPKRSRWFYGATSIVLVVAGLAALLGREWLSGTHTVSSAVADWDEVNPPRQLSTLGLFVGDIHDLKPAAGVVDYRLNSEAFFDYAQARRVFKLPPGQAIEYATQGPLEFPVGTLLAQTLGFPRATSGETGSATRRWVETRIIARTKTRWMGVSYVWNPEQTDAELAIVGEHLKAAQFEREAVVVPAGRHLVPNMNECKRCHKIDGRYQPLGVTAEQLNCESAGASTTSQLETWAQRGLLVGLPPRPLRPRLAAWNDPQSGTVAERARAWLQVNCAHCHDPVGAARNSGLHLAASVTSPAQYGVYKSPVAAGRGSGRWYYDIYPGRPDESILVYRISTAELGIVMPEYGRSVVHAEGVALVREWIAQMQSDDANSANLVGDTQELSAEQLANWAETVQSQGDAARGAEVFERRELNCLQCHALGLTGGRVGPDLSKLPADTTVAQLVESVLLPSKVVKPEYTALTVETSDGRVLTGVRVQDTSDTVILRDPVRGDTVLAKSEIENMAPAGSLMPTNVVARLAKQDFRDLIRYLASQIGQARSLRAGVDATQAEGSTSTTADSQHDAKGGSP